VTWSTANAPRVVPVTMDVFDMKARVANRNLSPLNAVLPNDLFGGVIGAIDVAHVPRRQASYPPAALDNK
jgi:hypothetical protein